MSAPDNTFKLATALEKLVKKAPQGVLRDSPESIAAKLAKATKTEVTPDGLHALLNHMSKVGRLSFVKDRYGRLSIFKPRPLDHQKPAREIEADALAALTVEAGTVGDDDE